MIDLGVRDRDREADVLRAPGIGDRGVDADDPALRVDQRTARVAGVDGGVGLEHVFERAPAVGPDLAVQARR